MVEAIKPRKGNKSWRPAALLEVKSRDPSFRLRWVDADPANLMRKRAEGWVTAEKGDAVHDRPPTVESGSGDQSSITSYRNMVLMKMPEEMALARAEYYQEQAAAQVATIKDRLNEDLGQRTGGKVQATGRITIE